MKKIFSLVLITFSILVSIAQDNIKSLEKKNDSLVKDDAFVQNIFSNKPREEHNSALVKASSQMSSTYHIKKVNSKNDFGSSKYDSEINWATDIDENNIQGSLNKFRQARREAELRPFINITIGVLVIGMLIVFYHYNRNSN